MNTTIVIAVGIILILALIVWAFTASAKKEAKKKRAELTTTLGALATEHDTTIGPSEFMGRKVIAMDIKKGKVFYVDNTEYTAKAEVINIAEVTDCAVVQSGSKHIESSKNKVTTGAYINKILLEVNTKTTGKVSLLFYDEAKDGVLEMLSLKEKAEKWKAVIKNPG